MDRKHFAFLDSMRGFAAAWVVLFHLNEVGQFSPNAYQWFVKAGSLGVPIFFVLSGYAIHSSVLRAPKLKVFLQRRFFRIYPPYIASLLIVMIVVLSRKLETGYNDLITLPHDFVGWLETITLTTKPITSTIPINWVYWTLSYEAAFYLWLAIALAMPKMRLLFLFFPVVLSLIWNDMPIFFINQWCIFALGAVIAEWRHRPGPLPIALAVLCLSDASLHRALGETVAACVAFILVFAALSNRFAWLNREPILHHVGSWSYSLYLTHVPIGVWLALSLDPWPRKLSGSSFATHIALDFYALTACCVFAYMFWRLVERPSYEFARGKTAKAESPESIRQNNQQAAQPERKS